MSEIATDYEEQQIVKKEVVYLRPSLFRRVMANLIDLILLLLITFLILLGAREIVNRTPDHIRRLNIVNNTRVESCLFVETKGKVVSTASYIKSNLDIPTAMKKMEIAQGYLEGLHNATYDIEGFINFCQRKGGEKFFSTVSENYDSYRLKKVYKLDNKKYFVRLDPTIEYPNGQVVRNTECSATYEDYFNVYCSYMNNEGIAYLSSGITYYKDALTSLSVDLFAIELPISYALAGILVYFVPPLFFKRGRKTLGKLAYKIGVVNSNCLNISFKQFIGRFLIFYFAIMILSVVTFAVPMLISFSMMVFSKGKQSFQDYMLGLYEVDTSGAKIYFNLEEAEIDQLNTAKKPIDFKRVEKE